jgi:hypothetical protein
MTRASLYDAEGEDCETSLEQGVPQVAEQAAAPFISVITQVVEEDKMPDVVPPRRALFVVNETAGWEIKESGPPPNSLRGMA